MGSQALVILIQRFSHFSSASVNAQVLTRPLKIDHSEGIPDPGILEWPFYKFAHRRCCFLLLHFSSFVFAHQYLWCTLTTQPT